MKVKVCEAVDVVLDYMVAKALGQPLIYLGRKWPTNDEETVEYAPWAIHKVIGAAGPYVPSLCHRTFAPSTEGDTVIDIMEREWISVVNPAGTSYWVASKFVPEPFPGR